MKVWIVEELNTDGYTFTCRDFKGVFSSLDKAETFVLERMEEDKEAELIITEQTVDTHTPKKL